jgi:hypothetical protein
VNVFDLERYRERRTVRRVAAIAVVTAGLYLAADHARRALSSVEWGIRTAARLLPVDVDRDETEGAPA